MHPEIFHKTVWEEMLYAQMRCNYFAELVRHYMNWDKGLRALALLGEFWSGRNRPGASECGRAEVRDANHCRGNQFLAAPQSIHIHGAGCVRTPCGMERSGPGL